MKKLILSTLITSIFASCVPIKEVISDNYELENDLNFKIINYSEPPTKASFIRNDNDKYVDIVIELNNQSPNTRTVNFDNFFIGNERDDKTFPLWRVNYYVQLAAQENKSITINGSESLKLWISFLAPKTDEIKYLYFNRKKIELNFGKTKQSL